MSEHTESDGRPVWRGLRLIGGLQSGQDASNSTFTHLDQVVSDLDLTLAEKREILSSWASDTRAVENEPALRQLDSGAVVRVEEVLRALKSLDKIDPPNRNDLQSLLRPSFARRDRRVPGIRRNRRLRWDRSDDDDD